MSKQTEAIIKRVVQIKKLEARISKLDAESKLLKAEKKRLESEGIVFLKKAELESISDSKFTVSFKETDVPKLISFVKFWDFVREENAPELMNRSVNSRGWREHDMNVPGVEAFSRETLSITKRK